MVFNWRIKQEAWLLIWVLLTADCESGVLERRHISLNAQFHFFGNSYDKESLRRTEHPKIGVGLRLIS